MPFPLAHLRDWLRLARWPEWSTSKLPYIGAAALLLGPEGVSVWQLFGILGTMILWAAYGYGINDIADRYQDLQAGKNNNASAFSTLQLVLFLLLTAGGALSLTFLWSAHPAAPTLVAGGLLLATSYSVRPLRFKERGILGLAVGSFSQWVLPVLAVAAARPSGGSHLDTVSVALLGMAVGTRWMAVHQLQDAANDRRAGVRTFATSGRRLWPVLMGSFSAEIVLLGTCLVLTWPTSVPAVMALGVWISHDARFSRHAMSLRERLRTYDHAPLAEYYFLLLPVSLALGSLRLSATHSALVAAFLFLGRGYLSKMIGELREGLVLRKTAS